MEQKMRVLFCMEQQLEQPLLLGTPRLEHTSGKMNQGFLSTHLDGEWLEKLQADHGRFHHALEKTKQT